MVTIYMDECGYTGPDLMDPAQPVFVLASLHLEESEAQEIAYRFFRDVRARELKHVHLSRRPRHQRRILAFLEHLGGRPELFRFAPVHKRFALATKIIDLVVEPCAAAQGINLYERGANLALSHLMFYGTPALHGEEFFESFLLAFKDFVCTPTQESLSAFLRVVRSIDLASDRVLGSIAALLEHWGPGILASIEDVAGECLDLGPPMALGLMASWRATTQGPMRLIHDQSSPFAKQQAFWDAVVDPGLVPAVLGYDRRTAQFPVGVAETRLERSDLWTGLQLADVLAGALTRCYASRLNAHAEDPYGDALAAVVLEWEPAGCIWPVPAFTPEALGTTGPDAEDPIAYLEPIMRGARKMKEWS